MERMIKITKSMSVINTLVTLAFAGFVAVLMLVVGVNCSGMFPSELVLAILIGSFAIFYCAITKAAVLWHAEFSPSRMSEQNVDAPVASTLWLSSQLSDAVIASLLALLFLGYGKETGFSAGMIMMGTLTLVNIISTSTAIAVSTNVPEEKYSRFLRTNLMSFVVYMAVSAYILL